MEVWGGGAVWRVGEGGRGGAGGERERGERERRGGVGRERWFGEGWRINRFLSSCQVGRRLSLVKRTMSLGTITKNVSLWYYFNVK